MRDTAVDKTVELRGLTFHYREYGTSGRPIVLLHGVASNSRIWITTAPRLADEFSLYTLDQRGHGESAKPDTGYDFETVVSDLDAFIDGLGLQQPVIVGHSWGGNVALEYAATHPDGIAGLIMVDGGYIEISSRPGATWERAETEMAPPDLTHLTPAQLIEGAKQWALGDIWSDEVEAALMGNFYVTDSGTIRPHLSRANHMQVVRALWEQRPSELFRSVQCPTLFVPAESSDSGRGKAWMAMKREAIARAKELVENCDVCWFEDTIHDIPLHRPEELAQTIRDFAETL